MEKLQMEDFTRWIVNAGYKVTDQRLEILQELYSTDSHLSADDLYERLKKRNIGIATVYRNLKLFRDIGFVRESTIDDCTYYEIILNKKNVSHIHFKCTNCKNIIDIDDDKILPYINRLDDAVEQSFNLEIADTEITYFGLCSKCKVKQD